MKFLIVRLVLFLLVLIGFTNCLFSQTSFADTIRSEQLYQMSLEDLLNIPVISSSKVEQRQIEAPNVVSAIPLDLSSYYGSRSINDILSFQPGFFIAQDYERSTVGFRGMFEGWNNNHLLMLIDGIPFNDNLYGTAYTWDITPLNFTNSLEVIFGPSSALYGTNAMNGVVSLNTLKAKDIDGIGRATLRLGSNNYEHYDIVSGVENDDFGLVAAFSGMSTRGNEYFSFDASGTTDEFGNPLRFKTNDSRSSSYFFTKFYGKSKYEGLMFQFHQQSWDFETGHGWLYVIPDRPESMKEFRRIFALRYAPTRSGKRFTHEFTSRLQIHGIDWNMRYYNDGAQAGYYPEGVSEYLKTKAKDLFFRAQSSFTEKNHNLIVGIESTTFLYNGDDGHYANIDMNTWVAPSEQLHYDLNPWLEFVVDKPVFNIAAYAQYISPKILDKLQITVSGRFDRMFFNYVDLSATSKPEKSKSFQMVTPRVAVVYSLSSKLVLKAIYGKAFRTPSPTEMFGYNTFTLASNIDELKPELVTNFDLSLNWESSQGFSARVNSFLVNFENQIAYSVANENLSANIYSLKTCGVEVAGQYASKEFTAFSNLSYAYRYNENILDSTITVSKTRVTWAPSVLAKLGVLYKFNHFSVSALGYYQNRVYRRNSDKFDEMSSYRPTDCVNGWFSINVRGSYKVTKKSEFSLQVNNLLNTERYSLKNNQYLFDYRLEGRIIIGEYVLRF